MQIWEVSHCPADFEEYNISIRPLQTESDAEAI